jgi:hypothetical protein
MEAVDVSAERSPHGITARVYHHTAFGVLIPDQG